MKSFAGSALTILAVTCLSACSTIIEGTSQHVAVSTSPSGATCSLQRDGRNLETIMATPAEVTVDKTKDDILVTCGKIGYSSASQYLHSGIATGTYGNIIAGGLVGWGVDSATGADNEYPGSVNLNLVPVPGGDQAANGSMTQSAYRQCVHDSTDPARDDRDRSFGYPTACN